MYRTNDKDSKIIYMIGENSYILKVMIVVIFNHVDK